MAVTWKHSAARVIVDEVLGRRVAEYLVLEATFPAKLLPALETDPIMVYFLYHAYLRV
jgi:hypothetical protein